MCPLLGRGDVHRGVPRDVRPRGLTCEIGTFRTTFVFDAQGVYVARDALGYSFEVARNDCRLVVTFPTHERDFLTWRSDDWYSAIGPPSVREADSESDDWDFVSIRAVRVDVEHETDFTVDDFESRSDRSQHGAFFAEVDAALHHGRDVAVQVFEELLAWARAGWSQAWLGLSSAGVELLGPATTVEVETGARLRYSLNVRRGALHLRNDDDALTASDLSVVGEQMRRGDDLPLAETFQADAEYLAWYHQPPDPVRAVLMAAIAAEIKVKSALLERASDERRPLIDFILTNHREVTVTAVDGLYDKLMKVAQGRSLRDDDRAAFKALQQLFTLRNAVAHSGARPDATTAAAAVRAARTAIQWVDAGNESASPCGASPRM